MADVLDLDKARERKSHVLREARVRKLRKAFEAARAGWGSEDASKNAGKLKDLFKKKKRKSRKK